MSLIAAQAYTPGYAPEDACARVAQMWDISGPFPLPRWEMGCLCGAMASEGGIQIRSWQFMTQANRPHPWRCNVSTKCTQCSLVLMYGLIIPEDYYAQGFARHGKTLVLWREALAVMGAQDI
jgi:hypothetical protein